LSLAGIALDWAPLSEMRLFALFLSQKWYIAGFSQAASSNRLRLHVSSYMNNILQVPVVPHLLP